MRDSGLEGLLRRLASSGKLPPADIEALLALPFARRRVPPSTYLVREGEPPRTCAILVSGFAFRHKLTGAGDRAIVSLHIPGEALDIQSLYLRRADHNVQTLTRADLAVLPLSALRDLLDERPALARAVLTDMLVEASVLREWIANIARRDARTRLAHLLCEFAYRLGAQGIVHDRYELPMTQEQLGDALGLTAVHVNRSIRLLEKEGLIERDGRALSFPNVEALHAAGDFSAGYLHLDQRPVLT